MLRVFVFGAALLSFVSLSLRGAEACLHKPKTYKEQIGQDSQEGLIIHADGKEELVLKVNLDLHGAPSGPDKLAWIVTIPAKPTSYKLAKASLFKDMFRWKYRLFRRDPNIPRVPVRRSRRASKAAKGLQFDRRVKLGAYSIQPIRGRSKADAKQLNRWLSRNGFATVSAGHLGYFLQRGFTFLCIKVQLPRRARELRPLRVSFPSKHLYYPLKFSSNQGAFDLKLYAFTKRPISYHQSLKQLQKIGFLHRRTQLSRLLNPYGWQKNHAIKMGDVPSSLRKLLDGKGKHQWLANYFGVTGVNQGASIKSWQEDFFLAPGKTKVDAFLVSKSAEIKKKALASRIQTNSWISRNEGLLQAWFRAVLAGKKPPVLRVAAVKKTTKRPPAPRDDVTKAPLLPMDSYTIPWTTIGLVGALVLFLFGGLGFLAWRRRS